MTADYHSAQGDFSSIVYNLSPMALTSFVMWLDVKVAEFKVYGQMLLDQQEDSDVTKWFLRSGITPDILPHAKQKPQFSNPRRYERSKRPISSTAPHPHVIPPSVSKQQKIDLSSDNDVVEIDSKSILPIESSMMEELTNLESEMTSYLGSSQNFKSNSQLSKSHPKQNSGTFQQKEVSSLKTDSASSRSVTDDTSHFITDSGNNLVETQTKTSSDLSITPTHSSVQLHESRTKTLESSVRSKIPYSKSNEHQSTSSPVSLQSSSHSKEINKITHSKPVDMIPAADTWASDNMDLVLKVEPADEEFDEIEKQDSHFQTISHTNHKMNMSDGNSFTPGQNVQIVSKDNAMYLDDGSGEQFTDEKVSDVLQRNEENLIPEVAKLYAERSNSDDISSQVNRSFQVVKTSPRTHYKCSHCSFETAYLFSMKRHTRKHTGDFLFCDLCSRYFYDTNALSMHMKAHKGELMCKFCKKQFISSNGLKVHLKRHCKSHPPQ